MSRKGFTLIELVVVLVILAILMAVAVPKYIDLTRAAGKSADMAYADSLRTEAALMMASNALSTNPVTNAAGVYWPANAASVYSNMTPTNYTFRYYTNVFYNFTNGSWTLLP